MYFGNYLCNLYVALMSLGWEWSQLMLTQTNISMFSRVKYMSAKMEGMDRWTNSHSM